MKRFLLLLLGLLCLFLFHFCGGDGDGDGGGGVVIVNTLDGATDVAVDSSFRYTFSRPVDASTVISTSYFILSLDEVSSDASMSLFDYGICNQASSIAASVLCRYFTVCDLTPALNLIESTRYAICLNTDITYLMGNPFEGFMAIFTTAAGGSYTVGGSLSGLDDGEQVILQNNGADDLTIAEDGEFTFPTEVADGGEYEVTVLTQPTGQFCTVSDGTGTVSGADVMDVSVVCEFGWAKSTTADPDASEYYGVAVDSNDNAYAVGRIRGNAQFDFGDGVTVTGDSAANNTVIVKYDSSGVAQWAKSTTTAPNTSYFSGVAVDSSGNAYAVGYIDGNVQFDFGDGITVTANYAAGNNTVIVKYDSSGVAQWAKSTTTAPGVCPFHGVAVDSNDNAYGVGRIYGNEQYDFGDGETVTTNYAGNNAAIVKYDSSGTTQWAKSTTTASNNSSIWGASVDGSGNAYAAGLIEGNVQYDFGDGVTVIGGNAGNNAVIVKYDSSGVAQWAKSTTTAPGISFFNGVAVDSSGNAYGAGRIYGNTQYDFGDGITVTANYAAGNNAAIVKYDSSGTTQGAKSTTTAPDASEYYGIAVDSSGNVRAVGYIDGNAQYDFGDGITVTGGNAGNNAVIVRYNNP